MKTTRNTVLGVLAFFSFLLVVTFWQSFDGTKTILTTDDPLGLLAHWKAILPAGWLAYWSSMNLVGLASIQASLSPTNVLLWVLPLTFFANWIYAIYTLGAAIFFFLFLRKKGCSTLSSCFGAVVYAYGCTNFTLVHGGHLGKFGCFCWFAATLWALEHSLQQPKRWSWRIAAGAFLGLTVTEQPDLAILYVWLFIAYAAFRVFVTSGLAREDALFRFVGVLVLSGLISGLVAGQVVSNMYSTQVKGITQVQSENKQEAWNWATQWSLPIEETLEFVAPGFFGWRVDDPAGLYWGKTGRSADYDTTKAGFPRFKLNTDFYGITPIFLAVVTGILAFRRRQDDIWGSERRRELAFWAIVAIVTLLLAFGRHFILYHFFYSLPKMNIIRNPNKFLHLFAVAVAVLSAHGLHSIEERKTGSLDINRLWKILAGLGAAAFLGAVYIFLSNESLVAKFQEEFQKASPLIVTNMTNALLRLTVSCGILAVLWYWLSRPNLSQRLWRVEPYVIIVLTAFDLYLTNRRYVEYYDYKPMYEENDLARFLKNDTDPHRSQLLTRGGFYNLWLTVYFPYHGIQTLDIPQLPRMPEDYQQYLGTLQPNLLRFWQLTNCRYLIGPLAGWQQIQNDPMTKPHFDLAYAYDVALSNNVVVTTPAKNGQFTPNTQVVIRYKQALPRVKLYDRWQVIPEDSRCLRTLNAREFDPSTEVIVSDPITPQTNALPGAAVSKPEWVNRTDNVAHLRVTTQRPGILLFNEKYDPNFTVTVDGKPVQLLRCNYIMKGVHVDAGTHEVNFEYRPPRIGFYLSVTAWIGCVVIIPALRWFESPGDRAKR